MSKKVIQDAAEADLETFIKLIHPQRVLGHIHQEVIRWMTRSDAKDHQLLLLPRDHAKSTMAAYYAAWMITKNPAIRILYISSTSNLAEKQLKFIKDILTSSIYQRYWPEMVNADEGKRAKWTTGEIEVDHELRKKEAIRDPTVFTAGLTTGITGLHCDLAILDDVVVNENASTKEGREKVKAQYSLLSSIEGANAKELVVGTRYDPNDLYSDLLGMKVEDFDEEGNLVSEESLYEVFERAVEDRGDGTGQFLWPRQQRYDGKWFGFNTQILATKRSKYLDKTQFRAQYYNDPNDIETALITRDMFQYYDRDRVVRDHGAVFYGGKRLNVYAGIDFAYTLGKNSDYTAVMVIGINEDNHIFVLDIDRFKTDKIRDYYESIFKLWQKWGFNTLRAETVAAQSIIVRDLKDNYITPNGMFLTVDEYRPSRALGSKEERMNATLQPRYQNLMVWHYKGGDCQTLEEELLMQRPPHDDLKDVLTATIDVARPPSKGFSTMRNKGKLFRQQHSNSRFGGIN